MSQYRVFVDSADTASIMTYAPETDLDQLRMVAGNLEGTIAATHIFNGKNINYDALKTPPIGLRPNVEYFGGDRYKPNGQWFEFFSVGIRMFFAPRLKDILERHGVKAVYSDAYLDFEGERLIYYNFVPLLALDATDWGESEVKMDPSDATNENVIQGRRMTRVLEIHKLVLDESKIPDGTPLFVLARNGWGIMLIREDIAREIQSAGIRGVSIKDIAGQKWS